MADGLVVGGGAGARSEAAPVLAYAGLVACVGLWGIVFVAVAKLLRHIDAVQVVTVRFAVVAAVAGGILAAVPSQRPHLQRGEVGRLLLCGLLAVPGAQYAIVEAQNSLSPLLTALVVTFSPAIAAVLAAVFLRARLGPTEVLGFALALLGVTLVLVVGAGTGSASAGASPGGAAIGLISPLSWAGYTLLVAPLVARHPPAGIACCVYIAGTLMTLPALPHALGGLDRLDGEDWAWIVGLASVATVVPNLLWAIGLKRLPVHRTSAFMYLVPVFAAIWAAAILGRSPEPVAIGGGLLVMVGVLLTQGWRGRRAAVEPVAGPPA